MLFMRSTYTHSSKNNGKVVTVVIHYTLFKLHQTCLPTNLSCNLIKNTNTVTKSFNFIDWIQCMKTEQFLIVDNNIIWRFLLSILTYIIVRQTCCRKYRDLLATSNAGKKLSNQIIILDYIGCKYWSDLCHTGNSSRSLWTKMDTCIWLLWWNIHLCYYQRSMEIK